MKNLGSSYGLVVLMWFCIMQFLYSALVIYNSLSEAFLFICNLNASDINMLSIVEVEFGCKNILKIRPLISDNSSLMQVPCLKDNCRTLMRRIT